MCEGFQDVYCRALALRKSPNVLGIEGRWHKAVFSGFSYRKVVGSSKCTMDTHHAQHWTEASGSTVEIKQSPGCIHLCLSFFRKWEAWGSPVYSMLFRLHNFSSHFQAVETSNPTLMAWGWGVSGIWWYGCQVECWNCPTLPTHPL